MAATLDLDQLRTFVAIAETGSFTRAADAVFKTQSAVSMQMRRLEERIGKPIFVRDGRASRLTEEGERLYELPGHPPDLAALPQGCSFRPRCVNAFAKCLTMPELLPAGPDRAARCHLLDRAREEASRG